MTSSPGIIPGLQYPSSTPLSEHPCMLEYNWQSRDYPRTTVPIQHPLVRVSLYAGITLAVPGLSQDYCTLSVPRCQSIPVCRNNTGSPGIIPGLLYPFSTPLSEYPCMLEYHWQSWGYPRTIVPFQHPLVPYASVSLEVSRLSQDYRIPL